MGDHPVDVGADLGGDPGPGSPRAQQGGEADLLGLAEPVEIEARGDSFLRAEVVVDAARAGAGLPADVGQGGLVVADGREALEGCVEDGLASPSGRLGAGPGLDGSGRLGGCGHGAVDPTSCPGPTRTIDWNMV